MGHTEIVVEQMPKRREQKSGTIQNWMVYTIPEWEVYGIVLPTFVEYPQVDQQVVVSLGQPCH